MKDLAMKMQKNRRHRDVVRLPRYPIRRFPRLPAEDIAADEVANRLAELEVQAFDWIARGHEANIQLGRIFLQMKGLKGHGHWEEYFIETFEPRGIPLRTGQHYMQLSKEADSVSAKIALFPLATDAEAQEINETTKAAQRAVALAVADEPAHDTAENITVRRGRKSRKESRRVSGVRPYTLVLPLPREIEDAMDKFRNSAH